MKKNMTFEEAVERLEEIAGLLEQGKAPLEQSLKLYEEGSALAAYCSAKLTSAQQKITELTLNMDSEQQAAVKEAE